MENAAEALKISGWVLIFVVALSICINSFSHARETMDTILEYSDRETLATWLEGERDGTGNLVTKRIVDYENMLPAIYRAYKENYIIRFENMGTTYLYDYLPELGATVEKINYIDIEKASVSDVKIPEYLNGTLNEDNATLRDYFIRRILFGDKGKYAAFGNHKEVYRDSTKSYDRDAWCESQLPKITFTTDGIYKFLKNNKFEESLGIYYQEELTDWDETALVDANKTEKRIITYKKIN